MGKKIKPTKPDSKVYRVLSEFQNLKTRFINLGKMELLQWILKCNSQFLSYLFPPKSDIKRANRKAKEIVLLYKLAFFTFGKNDDESVEFRKFFYEDMSLINRYFPDFDSVKKLLKYMLCDEKISFYLSEWKILKSIASTIEKQDENHQQQATSQEKEGYVKKCELEIEKLLNKIYSLNQYNFIESPQPIFNKEQVLVQIRFNKPEVDPIDIPGYLQIKSADFLLTNKKPFIESLSDNVQYNYLRYIYGVSDK